MLRVTDLKKTYATPDGAEAVAVVDVPRFGLGAGEQVALLGSSGSGKTTFLHLLAGILAADAGRIEYRLGENGACAMPGAGDPPPTPARLRAAPPRRPHYSSGDGAVDLAGLSESARDHFRGQHIGYIFQTHHLLPGLTAVENVLLGMSFTGRSPDRAWARHLLEVVGLAERLNYKPGKLSLGQQQRVAVARALANRPQLVLADEPTGSLDAAAAQVTLDLIRKLCAESEAALLLVTHDLGIAGQLGKRVELAGINRGARTRKYEDATGHEGLTR